MDAKQILEQFHDYLAPKLDTYEQAIYLYVLRHSRLQGFDEVVVGFKSARRRIALGIGEKGKPMAERTCYDKLRSLQAKGCLQVVASEQSGTRLRVRLPNEKGQRCSVEANEAAKCHIERGHLMFARHSVIALCTAATCCLLSLDGTARTQRDTTSKTRIVLLGTGTPSPDAERSGPATAIVVNGAPYLIDFGPGVVRRIAAAAEKGVQGLSVLNIKVVFLTHLHSDHTAGYPDLILTPWAVGRTHALEVYGPRGLRDMTRHILQAYGEDIRIRRQDKKTQGRPDQVDGYKVNAYEIAPGIVYQDPNVTVKAFLVKHGEVSRAFGYRFETPDRTIVISGDAAPSQSVIDHCNGCDVLIHEAYSLMTYNYVTRPYQEYREKHHTSSRELAELAKKARPGLLILYHRANPGGVGRPNPEDVLLDEVRAHYSGKVVTGHDLDVF